MNKSIPSITTDQIREVDRAMIEDFGIELMQMMENAGRNLANLARSRFLDGDPRGKTLVILAGKGGNGGGGLVCARRLHNWGAEVRVFSSAPASIFEGVPGLQVRILERMGVATTQWTEGAELPPADLVVDAIIGYSLRGAPSGASARMIEAGNASDAPVLSLDVPSGVDTATGQVHDPAVRADATMTLALPKTGLDAEGAKDYVGELYLADISVPPGLYAGPGLGLDVGPIFASEDIVRLR